MASKNVKRLKKVPETNRKKLLNQGTNKQIVLAIHQKFCVKRIITYMQQSVQLNIRGNDLEIKRSQCIVYSPTGSGKSFMILALVNFFVDCYCEAIVIPKNSYAYAATASKNWFDFA